MNNVEALQALYAALGGDPADVANASTSVEVLNAIAAKFDGEDDATINPDAITNIAAIAGNINAPTLTEKSVTANGTYTASSDNVDGYSEVTVNVPSGTEIENTVVLTPSGQNAKMLSGPGAGSSVTSAKAIFYEDGITSFQGNFANIQTIERVSFPKSLTTIQRSAFMGCTGLESVSIPTGVLTIGVTAFGGCTGLKAVTISGSVTSIDESAFGGCSNLKAIVIDKPESSISGAPWGATNAQVVWTG